MSETSFNQTRIKAQDIPRSIDIQDNPIGLRSRKFRGLAAVLTLALVGIGCSAKDDKDGTQDRHYGPLLSEPSPPETVQPELSAIRVLEDGKVLPSISWSLNNNLDAINPDQVGSAVMSAVDYYLETGKIEALDELCQQGGCGTTSDLVNGASQQQIFSVTSLDPGEGVHWRAPEWLTDSRGFTDYDTGVIDYRLETAGGAYISQQGRPYYVSFEISFGPNQLSLNEIAFLDINDRTDA